MTIFRPVLHALAQIVAGDDQILAAIILAVEYDVAVRVATIVLIDRDPIELRVQIVFCLAHQSPGKILEVRIVDRVVGRDDEPELVPVPVAPIEEACAVRPVVRCVIGIAGQAFASDAVALEIAEMGAGSVETSSRQFDQPGLDDDAPRAKGVITVSRRGCAMTAPRAGNVSIHVAQIMAAHIGITVAGPNELRFEFGVTVGHGSCFVVARTPSRQTPIRHGASRRDRDGAGTRGYASVWRVAKRADQATLHQKRCADRGIPDVRRASFILRCRGSDLLWRFLPDHIRSLPSKLIVAMRQRHEQSADV